MNSRFRFIEDGFFMKHLIYIILILCFSCGNENSESGQENIEKNSLDLVNEKVRENPSNPEVYIERANFHFESRNYEDALNDVKRSLVLDSSNAEVFLLEGRTHNALKESAKAKFSFLEAIKKAPNHIEARLELAQYYGGLTNYERAIEYVNDALRIDDQYAKAYFIKGLLYRKGGVDSLAISSIQTSLELDPTSIEPFIFLGDIFGERNNHLAVDYYQSALSIDSKNQQALYSLAYFYQNNKEGRKALQCYEQIIEQDESNSIVHHNMGYVQMQNLDNPDSAIYHFSNALKYNTQYYQAYYNRGLAYEQTERFEDARIDYKAALTLSHNYPLAIEGLNRIDKYFE